MRSSWKKERAPRTVRMLSLGVIVAGLVAGAGCSTMQVESLPAPDANLAGRTTFRIVREQPPVEARLNGDLSLARPMVMLNNPIIDQMVRDDIRRAFESRGYVMTDNDPDFEVTYYAKATERIEVDDIDYSYRYDRVYVDEFTEGTVVIDVLEPSTDRLLWRGSAVARVSDDPQKYSQQLATAVEEIVEEYPVAGRPAYIETETIEETLEEVEEEAEEAVGEGI